MENYISLYVYMLTIKMDVKHNKPDLKCIQQRLARGKHNISTTMSYATTSAQKTCCTDKCK